MTTSKKAPAKPAKSAAPAAKPAEPRKKPTQKKTEPKKVQQQEAAKKEPAMEPRKGIFKQPLQKPQPWSFGGRGTRPQDEGAKAQPDAERLAGKSRKVH